MKKEHGCVVVGVDDSPEALVAARYAVWEAQIRGLKLRVAHAYHMPPMTLPVSGQTIMDIGEAAESVLNVVVSQLEVPPSVWVETLLQQISPVVLLEQQAEVASMVVIGQHHVQWGERQLAGSVASQLAARADCPIVVVPRGWQQLAESKPPVVVALDGDTAAHAALRSAFEEAELRGTGIVALHAMPLESRQSEIAEHQANISEVLAGWQQEHPHTSVQMIMVPGDPEDSIIESVRGAAVLIVGRPHARGIGAWTRSVAHAVLKQTPCPLVVVPQDQSDRSRSLTNRFAERLIPVP